MEAAFRSDLDNYKKIAEALNKTGEMCKKVSMKLAYHNHDFEFDAINGQSGFDILMKDTDPKLANFELDIFWAVKANHDPLELFRKHPGRFVMWHIKDMDKTEKRSFTEVGNGIIDFHPIFKQAKQSGMKYFFVEQDQTPGSPFDSIAASINYLRKNIVN
jgi:sugar phosphate isomerase/epimerase